MAIDPIVPRDLIHFFAADLFPIEPAERGKHVYEEGERELALPFGGPSPFVDPDREGGDTSGFFDEAFDPAETLPPALYAKLTEREAHYLDTLDSHSPIYPDEGVEKMAHLLGLWQGLPPRR